MGERKQRRYGQDQPWREERRQRYPDEPYGGDREGRARADDRQSHRGPAWEANQNWRAEGPRGANYRGDFSPEGYGERYMGRDTEGRWNERDWNRGASFGFGPEEDMERSANYAYGSPYGQGDMNSDRAGRGDWNDTDWVANRPARGRGVWAGDWSLGRTSSADNYAGRGPKDYKRSDDRIREEVCDMLTDDPRVDPSEVVVKVESAEVTLLGSVSSRDQKRRAEEIAERARGVHDVINELRVVRGETTGGTTAWTQTATRAGRSTSAQQSGVAHDRERER
jgi:hypothetical protein